jgi:WD40 repeat protein
MNPTPPTNITGITTTASSSTQQQQQSSMILDISGRSSSSHPSLASLPPGASSTTTAAPAAVPGGVGGGASGGNDGGREIPAASETRPSTPPTISPADATKITDEAVLEYLKSKGMGTAVLELSEKLKSIGGGGLSTSTATDTNSSSSNNNSSSAVVVIPSGSGPSITINELNPDGTPKDRLVLMKEKLEAEDEATRIQRTILTKSTGGGFGYDRDAAAPIAQWGVPDNVALLRRASSEGGEKTTTGAGAGGESDAAGSTTTPATTPTPTISVRGSMGEREAKAYLDAFVAVQLWILSLPDDSDGTGLPGWQPKTVNVIARAKALIERGGVSEQHPTNKAGTTSSASVNNSNPNEGEEGTGSGPTTSTINEGEQGTTEGDTIEDVDATASNNQKASLAVVISELMNPAEPLPDSGAFPIPPSAKPELLAVCFALLVYTYCELLEVGMETTAHVLRDSFKPIYEPLYGEQYRDLYHCLSTEDMVKLNTHNSQHMEALAGLKTILVQIHQIQLKQEELSQARINDPATQQARTKKLQEYKQTIGLLQQKHAELSQRASTAFERMYDLPFLRRARAVRWQITLSTTSYGMLCQFLSNRTGSGGASDTSLLAMSTLLQTRCELHVEQRNPLPFTPAVVLEDNASSGMTTTRGLQHPPRSINEVNTDVRWAAPVPYNKISARDKALPFPKYNLDDEYDDEKSARIGKRGVEFNRALLVNGFRRLEALERKRDHEVMSKPSTTTINAGASNPNQSDPLAPTMGNNDDPVRHEQCQPIQVADPLEPSIMLSTLCANHFIREGISTSSPTKGGRGRTMSLGGAIDGSRNSSTAARSTTVPNAPANYMSEFLWEESGIGITCAKLCSPDGRQIAIGCDDSAIRVWNLLDDLGDNNGKKGQAAVGDAGKVLLGHKNGFPVFDLSWNRDGRGLLSAGGDGSIRLWDTSAQGPFGEVIPVNDIAANTSVSSTSGNKKPVVSSTAAKDALNKATELFQRALRQPDMNVPGIRPESRPYSSGGALAVYRGHAPNTPIWSVAFAPCGYYFVSGGSDATARLWTTDRPVPVRLFTGHTANCVHSVTFHPNCNYVLSGSEDKTVRLWDIQTGRCVRLMNGCPTGIYKVEVDPSGQYAVGADLFGTIHVWDLASGKKVTELRGPKPSSTLPTLSSDQTSQRRQNVGMVHSLAFSPCGTALASGGDDRCVRIWDIRKATADPTSVLGTPTNSFATRRTMILDLQYTKRNLLLSVGKYISAIPTVNAIVD